MLSACPGKTKPFTCRLESNEQLCMSANVHVYKQAAAILVFIHLNSELLVNVNSFNVIKKYVCITIALCKLVVIKN